MDNQDLGIKKIIEEFRKKWDIKGAKVWWESPFEKCYNKGISDTLAKVEDILQSVEIKICESKCPCIRCESQKQLIFILRKEISAVKK